QHADGAQKWTFRTSGAITSAPVVSSDGGTVFVASRDYNIYAVSSTTGLRKWSFATDGPVISSPVQSANGAIVYVGSSDKK
ncbi:MAG: PQQ-binding-like beta-propeller repeat protein, partial [Promethearchaeia archaeon]